MTVRVDPRRLGLLKQLAAEAGVRPGELVQAWVEQRLDAERAGGGGPITPTASTADVTGALATLAGRLDDLVRRIATLEASPTAPSAPVPAAEPTAPRKRGRPRTTDAAATRARAPIRRRSSRRARATAGPRVPLHDEIIAVIRERGPLTAAELAAAVKERGIYRAPRSAHPLDAAIVNSRVSNPVYRARFRRDAGRIGLAQE